MVTAVVILSVAVVVLGMGCWVLAAYLTEANTRAHYSEDVAEGYLQMLRRAGLVNCVNTCKRTPGGAP